jgi:hypothetical protein
MEMISETSATIDDYLRAAVSPYLSGLLINPEGWRRIRHWASQLPGAMTEFLGFEIRLGTPEALADFLICSERDSITRIKSLRERDDASGFWRRLNPFFRRWADPASGLYANVHNFWLEFDTSVSDMLAMPSGFFGANDLTATAAERPGSGWLTEDAIPLLAGKNLDEKESRCIRHCISALPEGAFLFQIGRMLSRPVDATRLCARRMNVESIPAFLKTIQWPGSMDQLGDLLAWLAAASARIDVDIDAAAEIMPHIGFECYFSSGLQQIELARKLQERGLATTDKTNAALSWAGVVHERIRPDDWPLDLRAISALLEGRASSVFLRWLHHIKVALAPDGGLEAKAYLAVSHNWLTADQVRALIQNGNL